MTMKFLSIAAAVTALSAQSALAASCAPRESVVERLETKYSEHLIARGLQSKNALMEIFGSSESGTYTVLITTPKGVSCVVSAGTNLMVQEPVLVEPGTAS